MPGGVRSRSMAPLKRDPEKAPASNAPQDAVQQRGLREIVRWLARAAARTWVSEQPATDELSGEAGRSSPSAKLSLSSEREDSPLE